MSAAGFGPVLVTVAVKVADSPVASWAAVEVTVTARSP